MKSFHKKRLLKLADYLETVPPQAFNMSSWKCGTAACAVGHACDIPSFRRAGLYLEHDEAGFTPVYLDKCSFEAAQEFFGISPTDAEHLFCPENYDPTSFSCLAPKAKIKKKDVIKRIRKFVADATKQKKH